MISKSWDRKKKGANLKRTHSKTGKEKEDKECQTNTIIDVCITDTDMKPYISKPLQSVLAVQEKEKKQLSRKLATKWECPPSKTANYIKTTLSLSLVMCAFFINEHMLMAIQGWGRHWLRHSGSRPSSFSPWMNHVGLAQTQANNNTVNKNIDNN
eukprot:14909091-Ditylum_brightwellii.AAC.1